MSDARTKWTEAHEAARRFWDHEHSQNGVSDHEEDVDYETIDDALDAGEKAERERDEERVRVAELERQRDYIDEDRHKALGEVERLRGALEETVAALRVEADQYREEDGSYQAYGSELWDICDAARTVLAFGETGGEGVTTAPSGPIPLGAYPERHGRPAPRPVRPAAPKKEDGRNG